MIYEQFTFSLHVYSDALDLQGSCKEECSSDYIGGLTVKNKTQPSDVCIFFKSIF